MKSIFGSLVLGIIMLIGCSETSKVSSLKTDGGVGGSTASGSSSVVTSSVSSSASSSVSSASSGTLVIECNPPKDCADKVSK